MNSVIRAPYIILAAGGTGGHMMPAEAVADALLADGYEVSLVTDKRGQLIGNVMADVHRIVLGASSHMGGGLLGKIKALFSLVASTFRVRKTFRKRRPTVVVGFGGYPSLPAVMAARSMGIPYILHEQNAILGRVNRFMARNAHLVALSIEATERVPEGTKTFITGNPVRQLIAKLANIAYAVPMGFGDIRVFILGGSQGARVLSDVVPAAAALLGEDLKQRLDIVHQARIEDIDRVSKIYETAGIKAQVEPYFNDVGAILLRTQLVICRSGASTLSELSAMGRPAIMVPLAIAADNHQAANAKIIADAGGGIVIEEPDFTPETLAQKLSALFARMGELRDWSDGMRSVARLDAATKLSNAIIEFCDSEGLRA